MDVVASPLSPLNHNKNDRKRKNTPPRGVNGAGDNRGKNPISPSKIPAIRNDDGRSSTSSNSSSNDEERLSPSSLKKTVVIIHDDTMTEDDDTDVEEEEDDEILGLAHESDDVPNLLLKQSMKKKSIDSDSYEYNAYAPHGHDNLYHPTSSIFENNNDGDKSNKDINIGQPGLFGDRDSNPSFLTPQFSTSEEAFLQDTSFYERAAFNRRPSQLQHEMTTLNALGPPSHVLKARRLSKNTIKSSASTPITPVKSLSTTSLSSTSIRDKRRPSILDNYREFSNSNNSAVSPRFMALRKLSEVTTLPPHSISYSIVPPVPQIPSTYQNTAGERNNDPSSVVNGSASNNSESNQDNNSVTIGNNDHESRILARIDDIIETQLQFHLGQVIWRASESHLEARKFWEEQKKEMFGFAATIVDRIESQEDLARKMTLGSLTSATSTEENEEVDNLRKELNTYKSKSQRKSFELDMLKTRNQELEKQHEIDTISIAKQWQEKDSTLKRLHQLEQERKNLGRSTNSTNIKQKDLQTKLFNLETENKQLKKQIKQIQEVNRQLLEDATTFEKSLNSRDKEIKQLKQQLADAESQITVNKRKMVQTESTTTTATGALDCGEDFGKKISNSTKKKDTSISTDKGLKKTTSKDDINKDTNKDNNDTSSNTVDSPKKDNEKMENWADIMQSEDEAKKSAEEWAKKYRELQTSYFDVCLQLEKLKKEGASMGDEKKIIELSQSIAAKDEEIRHLKQAENVNRIQMNYMQLELDKYQNLTVSRPSSALSLQEKRSNQNKAAYRSKNKSQQQRKSAIVSSSAPASSRSRDISSPQPASLSPPTNNINNDKTQVSSSTAAVTPPFAPSPKPEKSTTQDYVTEDGFLTFTTEINGQLSKYSIKLPTGYGKRQANATPKPSTIKKNKLNPNALSWKS